MKERVSIIIPIYNMGDSVEVCVQSLLQQDYPNKEIILIDDGSQDNSYDCCLALAKKYANIQVYHTENRGSGPARNYGLKKATGRYVYFPDADDKLDSNALSIMVASMTLGCDLVVFGYRSIDDRGKLLSQKNYPDLIVKGEDIRNDYFDYITTLSPLGIQGAPWNKLFDLNIIRLNNIDYPALRRHQDEGFIARYMCYAQRVHFIPDILYTYYVNSLQKEWKKYPVDYIDAVIGLFETRKETILAWNTSDIRTQEHIYREYIYKVIKSLELSYSPKMGFKNSQDRRKYQQSLVQKSDLIHVPIPRELRYYQKYVLSMIHHNYYLLTDLLIRFKVFIQEKGIMRFFK